MPNRSPSPFLHRCLIYTMVLFCLVCSSWSRAAVNDDELILLIQPTLGKEETQHMYQPLAEYLSKAAGLPVTIVTRPNFFAHWSTVRSNTGYDLVLDDAHFTDYRLHKFGFRLLAKIPGMTSYSLMVLREKKTRSPLQLAGKKVASLGPPSIGALRLGSVFPNPARQPSIVEVASVTKGIELLKQDRVSAAMLPTTVIGELIERDRVTILVTTEPTPHMALSASPRVTLEIQILLREALVNIGKSEEGRTVLRETGLGRFERASDDIYHNQSRILREYWGY